MSEEDYTEQFVELIKLSELNEARTVLLILELNGIPMRSYVYKHDTQSGNEFLDRYNKLFADFKKWVEEQEEKQIKEVKENESTPI